MKSRGKALGGCVLVAILVLRNSAIVHNSAVVHSNEEDRGKALCGPVSSGQMVLTPWISHSIDAISITIRVIIIIILSMIADQYHYHHHSIQLILPVIAYQYHHHRIHHHHHHHHHCCFGFISWINETDVCLVSVYQSVKMSS